MCWELTGPQPPKPPSEPDVFVPWPTTVIKTDKVSKEKINTAVKK